MSVVLVLAACGSADTSATDPVTVLEYYYDALTAGDLEKAMSFFADEAVFIDPMGKYLGKENIQEVYAAQMNIGGKWEPANIKDTNGSQVFSGTGLTVVKEGKIIFDGLEFLWKGECKRDASQNFCSD